MVDSDKDFSEKQKAISFWEWFSKEKNKYLFLNQVNESEKERLLDCFLEKLHSYSENIFFEIGGHPEDTKVELIITAEGNQEFFDTVKILVNGAPEFENWKVIALKPPMGTGYKTEYGGYVFDPETTIFIPLNSEENPEDVGIRVCYSEFNEKKRDVFTNGTYLMLEVILGEKSTAIDIDYLDIIKTPRNIREYNFKHLNSIKEYIRAKRLNANKGV